MPVDIEERRQQDLRDLEFYSKRVRPTASDLLRTNELSSKYNIIKDISENSIERCRREQGTNTPASLAEIHADSQYGKGRPDEDRNATESRSDTIWLFAVVIILLLLGWSGEVDRAMMAFIF